MRIAQTFSNKIIGLTGVQDCERITTEFNRLTKDYYAKEKYAIQQLRTLRQIRIRLSLTKKTYEMTGRDVEAELVIRLLKNEEEIVLTLISQARGSDQLSTGGKHTHLNWSGKLIDLVEVAYGLYVSRCVNGGRCDIKEIVFNRKNGRTPFLKWLCERIEQDAYEKDE